MSEAAREALALPAEGALVPWLCSLGRSAAGARRASHGHEIKPLLPVGLGRRW